MKRLTAVVLLALVAGALVAQEPEAPPEPDPAGADATPGETGAVGEGEGETEGLSPEDADAPDAEALAEAAAAAGGEIGEVEEDFTPEDEISEDYPVPLPADI